MNRKAVLDTAVLEKSSDPNVCYRRPGIISGEDGCLICFYEEQYLSDPKRQTLICRTSDDEGRGWSDRIVLASGGTTGMLHNVMMAYSGGEYHCLWNVQYRQLWYRKSRDGVSWSEPKDLTRSIWRADCDYEWNAFGIGSGHGVTLDDGTVLIPTWFTTGGDGHKPSAFACIYTKDNFSSLKIGATLADGGDIKNPNEGAVAAAGGKVFATVRHDNAVRARAVTVSRDGIEGWSKPAFRTDLADPICHASLLAIGDRLFFCNCNNSDPDHEANYKSGKSRFIFSEDSRKNLTVRESNDGGESFDGGVKIADKAGYSDLAAAGDRLLCIYECGWNEEQSCIFPHEMAITAIGI